MVCLLKIISLFDSIEQFLPDVKQNFPKQNLKEYLFVDCTFGLWILSYYHLDISLN